LIVALGKQAKTLSEAQIRTVMAHLAETRAATRNQAMFLLSVDAGLRAKEIASVTWEMVTDSSGLVGDAIRLEDKASKGKSGGVVFMSKRLRAHLMAFGDMEKMEGTIIKSRNGRSMSAQVVTNWFFALYKDLGFDGCSSHSGRRTAITRWARSITSAGGSMRDVQALARHASLAMTQRYVEVSADAMRKVVG
jgi:integrase/recombinase XerD